MLEESPKVKYLIFVSLSTVNMIRANLVDIPALLLPLAVTVLLSVTPFTAATSAETPSHSRASTCVSGFCLQKDYNRLEV